MTPDVDPRDQVIVGVDTHADQHTAVALNGLGRLLDVIQIETSEAGYRSLIHWAGSFGSFERAGVEGCGAYGLGLARHLADVGIKVIEVDRPNRQRRRRRGKSDPTDAEAAARGVLAGEATTVPKDRTGPAEAVRILHMTRRSAVKAKIQAGNPIKDLVLTAPESIRAELRDRNTRQRVRICTSLPPYTTDRPPIRDSSSPARSRPTLARSQ